MASVRDHLSWKSMQFPDMCKAQASRSEGCDRSMRQNEVGHLTHGIYNIHDCIVAVRLWELDDEVNADGVPMELQNREWS